MARVCWLFWAPASRLVWRDVPWFSHLLRLFPEYRRAASCEYENEYVEYARFITELTPTSWTRFRLYAPFVRKLGINVEQENYDALIRLCIHSNGQLLLPHLQEIYIEVGFSEAGMVSAQGMQEIFEILLGPSLKAIDFRDVGQGGASDEMALPSLTEST
ncbi:hypothetical protein FRB90_007321 [Tulasnella sp. 427]|nr:hypothetical protein FRB90_007321 [Tulasnella sp. 427]